ncbi:MAG: TlpA family protein disulfide reductase [bacterium]|nr:TlpA family protein disulfide reductase [bacterium]
MNGNNNDGPAVEGVRVGNIAITFTEIDTNGNSFSLDSLKGKVIFLNFSAMWCGPCRQEAPQLNEIYNTYHERGLEIIQCIYQDEDGNPSTIDDINRWLQEFGCPYTVINDPDRSSVDTYNFGSIPYNIIIDRDFIIRYVMAGFDHDEVVQKINQYL